MALHRSGLLLCARVLEQERQCFRCLGAVADRTFSTTPSRDEKSYKMVIVGGGTGGCTMANKYASKFGKGKVAVIEPSEAHYYQPMWTLVGGGIKKFEETRTPMGKVLPKNADWIKDKAVAFDPKACTVTVGSGEQVKYEYLIVAMGMQLNYHLIKGLPEAFDVDPQICSNYSPIYVHKTWKALQNFKGGNAIFTFPNTPIKCAGAPQKIMYLAEEYFTRSGKRDKANVMFNSSLGVIFGVKKYAKALMEICNNRNINLNFKRCLVEIRPEKKEADFKLLDTEAEEIETYNYDFLHVVPPMSAPDSLKESPIVDGTGYLAVNKETLQHVVYPNIFGLGDCSNVPTSRTAAAVASQVGVLRKTINAVLKGHEPQPLYDGYTSCPLVTGYGKCIMAEFDFNANPKETFPIDQGKERRSMYHFKKDVFPRMYWHMLLNGYWEGPNITREIMHLGFAPKPGEPVESSSFGK